MNHFSIAPIKLLLFCGIGLSSLFNTQTLEAQKTSRTITVTNPSNATLYNYTAEIPTEKLKLGMGNYMAVFRHLEVPVEISETLNGKQVAAFPIDKMEAHEKLDIIIKQGEPRFYPKRTSAELTHKIGGHFEGKRYVGDYSWVKPNAMSLPGTFEDHAYYIKYEGPGWENENVAFRSYLDNRNAIDVYGKKTNGMVMSGVGMDGYENYHHPAIWGMDNTQVGKSLGLGSIAIWDGTNAHRVDNKDSTTCVIQLDGKVRSQILTTYYGWNALGVKCNLQSMITIDAGGRASHVQLKTDKEIKNLATGITLTSKAELMQGNKNTEWTYVATFGKQSMNDDMQGLAIFVRSEQLQMVTTDKFSNVLVLKPVNNKVDYYIMPTWELDTKPVVSKSDFQKCINEELDRLNNKLQIIIH